MDIISKIVLRRELACIEEPDFRNEFIDYLHAAFSTGWIATPFPSLAQIALWMSARSELTLTPNPLIDFKRKCRNITSSYLEVFDPKAHHGGEKTKLTLPIANNERSVVIDMLLGPDLTGGHTVPTLEELNDEAVILLTAGNDTTSNSMIFGIYQICSHPTVYSKLFLELKESGPNINTPITYEQAKQLPYLAAVIKEILRLGNPLSGRLPRLIPVQGISLYGKQLSAQTSTHISPYLLNCHRDVWENPDDFKPERWLGADAAYFDTYVATFNKGARQWLGRELAWCELWVFFANRFRRFEIEMQPASMAWRDLILIALNEKLTANTTRRSV